MKRRILTLIPVLLVMALIFFFSAQTQTESSQTSGHLEKVVIAVLERYFNGQIADQEALLNQVSHIVRKLAHFTEFAVLGFFLMLHLSDRKKGWLWSGVVGIIYAISDEIHQIFVDGRGPGIIDVCIDSLGVLTGIGVMRGLLLLITHRKNDKG